MLSQPAEDAVEVNYRSMAGAADESIDYPGFNGTLAFAPCETSKTVEVRVRLTAFPRPMKVSASNCLIPAAAFSPATPRCRARTPLSWVTMASISTASFR
ncbi:Calx-beta domain-containing protein [Leisingera sp. NJS204]|uniref:Calx-beta domain-containing protein n=1 Tax=Leisingera sp. NJS204 TaxID=2508307 RepID=UPI003F8D29A6